MILVSLLMIVLNVIGQEENYCGTTTLSDEQMSFLDHFHSYPDLYKDEAEAIYYIPVKVHIVGDDNGYGYYRKEDVMTALCELNDHFQPVGFHFYLKDEIHYIDNTSYYVHDFTNGGLMMAQHNVSKALNIYFVADPAGNCGYFSPAKDAVAIKKTCANPGETTIAHEVGHYFSLPHTFNGWEGGTPPNHKKERADGSNCATTGDRFCDTPADYLANRWTCPYNGTPLIDPVGDTVKPDGSFYMSYSNDECTNRFSNQQRNSMKNYLLNNRSNLISGSQPTVVQLDTSALMVPANNAVDVPSDFVLFQWRSVPNATAYHLNVSRFTNFFVSQVDEIVTDTLFITNVLLDGVNYKWKVKPIVPANTCTDYTYVWRFTVGAPTGSQVLIPGNIGLKLFPQPATQGEFITISSDLIATGNCKVDVFSMDGKRVFSDKLERSIENKATLHTSGLTPGLYVLRIIDGQQFATGKFVIAE